MEYRITVFGEQTVTRRKGRKIVTETIQAGWQARNPDKAQEARHARLPGDGSFYWPGAREAWDEAVRLVRAPETRQVKVETIGGKPVARLFRTAAGWYAYSYAGLGYCENP